MQTEIQWEEGLDSMAAADSLKNWREVSISEICSSVKSGGTPLSTVKDYYENGQIPWLKTKEIKNGRIYGAENRITEMGLLNSSASLIPANSISVAMYGDGGTAGRVGLTKVPLTTNQACCNLTIDECKADYEFIFYNLLGSYDDLVAMKTGSGQQNLSSTLIKNFKLNLPPLPEQRTIANVLSSLDDKIDLLSRQNTTLEALSETLFRQWFVEEPKEYWEENSLSSIASFLNGLACQKFLPKNEIDKLPVLKIKDLRNGFSDDNDWATTDVKPEYIIENGDIIFAWSASLMVKIWDGMRCILNQHLFKVTSDIYPKWFYYYWCKHHLQNFISISESHATTMGHIKRGDLDEALVVVPPSVELAEMDVVFTPSLEKVIANNKQINSLYALRNALLPKLMSGEVRVDFTDGKA